MLIQPLLGTLEPPQTSSSVPSSAPWHGQRVPYLAPPRLASLILERAAAKPQLGSNLERRRRKLERLPLRWSETAVRAGRSFEVSVLGTASMVACALVLFAVEVILAIQGSMIIPVTPSEKGVYPYIAALGGEVNYFVFVHVVLLVFMLPAICASQKSGEVTLVVVTRGAVTLVAIHSADRPMLSAGYAGLVQAMDLGIFLSSCLGAWFALRAKNAAEAALGLLDLEHDAEAYLTISQAPPPQAPSSGGPEEEPKEVDGVNEEEEEECVICQQPLYGGGAVETTESTSTNVDGNDGDAAAGEDMSTVATMICGHSYHLTCLLGWLAKSRRCPICRTRVDGLREDENLSRPPSRQISGLPPSRQISGGPAHPVGGPGISDEDVAAAVRMMEEGGQGFAAPRQVSAGRSATEGARDDNSPDGPGRWRALLGEETEDTMTGCFLAPWIRSDRGAQFWIFFLDCVLFAILLYFVLTTKQLLLVVSGLVVILVLSKALNSSPLAPLRWLCSPFQQAFLAFSL